MALLDSSNGKYKLFPAVLQNSSEHGDLPIDESQVRFLGKFQTLDSLDCSYPESYKWLRSCKQNPGHTKFIPFETFSLRHMPGSFRDSDLYEFLKVVANMTVRVDIQSAVNIRQTWMANGNIPIQIMVTKSGSGRLWNMNKYVSGVSQLKRRSRFGKCCPCLTCQLSEVPSKEWWEVHVESALHMATRVLVPTQISFQLFYDAEDSPPIIIDTVVVNSVNEQNSSCMLLGVTCDAGIADRLETTWNQFDSLWQKVSNKFLTGKSDRRLSFIVSHAYGRPKHVSVNQWRDTYELPDDLFNTRINYAPCTCPDSSGAFIYIVGYAWGLGGWHQSHTV